VSLKTLKSLRTRAIGFLRAIIGTSHGDVDRVTWVTIRTMSLRWEAELMQQVLVAHDIPTRIVALGVGFYMGQGSPAALQVTSDDEQAALSLLVPLEETTETIE
jgi:hypothetical protein